MLAIAVAIGYAHIYLPLLRYLFFFLYTFILSKPLQIASNILRKLNRCVNNGCLIVDHQRVAIDALTYSKRHFLQLFINNVSRQAVR